MCVASGCVPRSFGRCLGEYCAELLTLQRVYEAINRTIRQEVRHCSRAKERAFKSSIRVFSRGTGFDNLGLFVKDQVQQRGVNLDAAILLDQSHFPKFVHEKADAESGRANRLGESFLADLRDQGLRLSILAEIRPGRSTNVQEKKAILRDSRSAHAIALSRQRPSLKARKACGLWRFFRQ
jgi:hypothetical protein